MKQPLLEKLLWWFCDLLNHSFDKRDSGWLHNDKHHRICQRCRRIVSKDLI